LDVARVFLEIKGNRGIKEMREVNVKVLNPYVLQILIPGNLSTSIHLSLSSHC